MPDSGTADDPEPSPPTPAPAYRPSLRRALVVFQFRYYRYLWLSSTFAFLGMQMQQVARALLAWQLTESYGAMGMIALSFGLPMLLLSLIGGALSDRFEKRNIVFYTQVANAAIALAHAIPVATGTMTIELLFVLGLLQGTGFALGMPARMPLMAEAVGRSNMMSGMAMSNASMNGTRLLGPAIAGILIASVGMASAYWVQAGLNTTAALFLLFVPKGLGAMNIGGEAGVASHRRPQGNMFVEIGRGLRYIVTDPRLRLLMSMMFIVTVFAMPYIMLLAGFVQEDLGQGEQAYGWMQSTMGIGAIVASIAVASFTDFDRKPLIQWGTGLLGGASLILLALGSEWFGFAGAVVAVIMLGLWLTAYQTLNNTMLMDAAEPQYYGRVMSVNMLSFSIMPLVSYPLGALADVIGAAEVFALMGAVVILGVLASGIINPRYTFGRNAPRGHAPPASPAPRPDAPDLALPTATVEAGTAGGGG